MTLIMLGDSDLLMLYNAYCSWRRACNAGGSAEQQFCRKNSLSQQNLRSIEELKAQLAISLIDADFLTLEEGEEVSLNKFVPCSRLLDCVSLTSAGSGHGLRRGHLSMFLRDTISTRPISS